MADVLVPLSVDEDAVLQIAKEGQSIMPIGRWEASVKSLAKRGFLERADAFNYFITDAGRAALESSVAAEDEALGAMITAAGKLQQAQREIQGFVEAAAQALAEAGRRTMATKGDWVENAVREWTKVAGDRALDLVREKPNA